jgi:hypothetical protein
MCRRFHRSALLLLPAVSAALLVSRFARAQGPDQTHESAAWGSYAAPVAADSHLSEVFGAGRAESLSAGNTAGAERWYGWQTLLTDVGSLSLVGIGAAVTDSSASRGKAVAITLSAVGAIGYALGGPIVHFENGQKSNAIASLALRAGLPVGGALAGYLVGLGSCTAHDDSGVPCPVAMSMIGGVSGLGAAVLVDALGLGYGPIASSRGTVVFAPTVEAAQSGVRLGISGAF